jgi:hypothetical protein
VTAELPEVQRLRLKLKAARALIRDLAVSAAQAEEALDAARRRGGCGCNCNCNDPQPKEAQGNEPDHHLAAA